jgi:hypothetical protein
MALTSFYLNELLPDGAHRAAPTDMRQVEVLRLSGTHEIHLRIGDVGDIDQGTGVSVVLTEKSAAAIIEGIETAFDLSGRSLPRRG